MKTKEKGYCVMGTSVRTGRRVEITNMDVFITKEDAETIKNILRKIWKPDNEMAFVNLRTKIKPQIMNLTNKCKDCVYANEAGNCWAIKAECNPYSIDCDYRKDEQL